jgi:hypothetical protein
MTQPEALEEFMSLPEWEFYTLIPGDRATRGRKIENPAILDSGQIDYIVVRNGADFLYVQFGEGKRGYDVFGNAHPVDDPFFAPLDCSKCGKATA